MCVQIFSCFLLEISVHEMLKKKKIKYKFKWPLYWEYSQGFTLMSFYLQNLGVSGLLLPRSGTSFVWLWCLKGSFWIHWNHKITSFLTARQSGENILNIADKLLMTKLTIIWGGPFSGGVKYALLPPPSTAVHCIASYTCAASTDMGRADSHLLQVIHWL